MQRILTVFLLVGALAACASGRPYSQLAPTENKLSPDQARVVVFRTQIFGFAIQPTIRVNGRETGSCTPDGVFYIDLNPGEYTISATTEKTESVLAILGAGEVIYVECSIDMGFLVGQPDLKIVKDYYANPKMQSLSFTGRW